MLVNKKQSWNTMHGEKLKIYTAFWRFADGASQYIYLSN